MEYQYSSYDINYYATMIRQDPANKHLVWDSTRGCNVLVIQGPYGVKPYDVMFEICKHLKEHPNLSYNYEEIIPDFYACIITPAYKIRNKGCSLLKEGSSYSIFCLAEKQGKTIVYAPQNEKNSTCYVPMLITVTIEQVYISKRVLFKKELRPSEFYKVIFQMEHMELYQEGSMICKVHNMEYPVTQAMLKQREIYIKTEQRPIIQSNHSGIKIIQGGL